MDFKGFALGLQFIVSDFSIENKRRLWTLALTPVSTSGIPKLKLYDLLLPANNNGEESRYVCIIMSNNIKEGRLLTSLMKQDTRLWTQLDPLETIIQENVLELVADSCTFLGTLLQDGSISLEDVIEQPLPQRVEPSILNLNSKKILVAVDSMKERFSSMELGKIICSKLHSLTPCRASYIMVGDGGEGTVNALVAGQKGRIVSCKVHDANMNEVMAHYGILPNRKVVIECAEAVGFSRGGLDTSILTRTSFGVGEMMAHALSSGYTDIYLCIGGTTTSDGGEGMLKALGFSFDDQMGFETSFDRLKNATITAVCDVNNPLLGEDGAVNVYARQKGATEDDCIQLEKKLALLAAYNPKVAGRSGAGSGGGIGFACGAFLNAKLIDGAEWVLDQIGFAEKIKGVDLVVTGEGKMDGQTVMHNKIVKRIIEICHFQKKPTCVLAGMFTDAAKEYINSISESVCYCECPIEGKNQDAIEPALTRMLTLKPVKNALRNV